MTITTIDVQKSNISDEVFAQRLRSLVNELNDEIDLARQHKIAAKVLVQPWSGRERVFIQITKEL